MKRSAHRQKRGEAAAPQDTNEEAQLACSPPAQMMPTEVWEIILKDIANVLMPCGHWHDIEQEKVRRPPRVANAFGFDPEDEDSQNPRAGTYRDILLNCSQVCQAFRKITLPVLWREFTLPSVAAVQFYDTLFASMPDAAQLYGKHVKALRFTWKCSGEVPYDLKSSTKTLTDYVLLYRPRMTLLKCAFADRRHPTSLEDFDPGYDPEYGEGWHAVTNGPDGHGTLSEIKTAQDLSDALVRIVSHLPSLETIEWNASVLPIPRKVAAKIEKVSGDTLHSVHIIDQTEAISRCAHSMENKTKHTFSAIPGITKNLKHLRVDDDHEEANDTNPEEWLVADPKSPFGFRVLPPTVPHQYDAPSLRWIVEQCWKGAHLGKLQTVELSSSSALGLRAVYPLWTVLDFRVNEEACEEFHGNKKFEFEFAMDEEEGELVVQIRPDEHRRARTGVQAMASIRKAIQACDRSQRGWLKTALEALLRETKVKTAELEAKLDAIEKDLKAKTEENMGVPPDEEHERLHAKMTNVEATKATTFFLERFLENKATLRDTTKCWEKLDSKKGRVALQR